MVDGAGVSRLRGAHPHGRIAAAFNDVMDSSARAGVAVMCSESLWWPCHRRLIADAATLAPGCPVAHVMPDAAACEHRVAAAARVRADGLVVWDRG